MKADLGASKTYLCKRNMKYLDNIKVLLDGSKATLTDNFCIQASAQGNLPLHKNVTLPSLVYPALNNKSLLSIGQLCDEDCVVIFDKKLFSIIENNKVILQGNRNLRDSL